ncbi:MAG TPA: molecular chaperone DnaJ, partial [Candidatus Limousia pullorum]|nr:molecular chaperone DnaJ [Candidatus Limousia pullorum]
YRAAFNRMNSQRAYGAGGYDPRGGAAGCSCCDICVGLWCADTCCSCMGGNCC